LRLKTCPCDDRRPADAAENLEGNRLGFVQTEIDKIGLSLRGMAHGPHRDELCATQQALAWSLDPLNFESPLAMIGRFDLSTRAGSEDCPCSSDPASS
jgi:hypothetical protein